MNLLAIPNDSAKAYFRCSKDEFLGEFNPLDDEKRFFEKVSFLNCMDSESVEFQGIESYPVVRCKDKLKKRLKVAQKDGFCYPMFSDIFMEEKEDILLKARLSKPDIVRTFNPGIMAELGIIISNELEIPLIISVYDPSSLTSAVKKANLITYETEEVKEKCINELNIDASKLVKSYNGIEEYVFFNREKRNIKKIVNPRFFKYDKVVLSCSRVVDGKNMEGILKSICLIKEDFPNLLHLHLGAEPDKNKKDYLIQLRNELGLKNTSFFLGPQPKQNLPFYYSFADVYILPSFWEGMNRSVRESLFCGTPVITTNYGSMTEFVKDNYNGLLVNPYNCEDIARGLEIILGDNKLRTRLSSNSRKSIINEHSLRKTMSDAVLMYKKILSQ